MTNLLNTTLGQYQIVALLGEGGMATVYKAWQPSLRRYVALKVLAPHLSHDAEFVQRFHQEAVSAANLRHSSIVTIHDVGTESGYHHIAMESIEGASLQKRIRSGQTFTPQQVADVISQIGSALDYAHQRGFIHRDIKPANILIDASGRAVLTDFGIVKALSGSGLTAALTQAGTIIGTPHYMSPEQVKDEPLDHRSDLYSLGIVCYEMLAGQVPFGGNTTHAILYAQVNTSPPPLRQALGPAVPPAVEAVVGKMLAKERENRYNSGGEFARDLAQAVSGVRPAGVGGEAPGGRRAGAGRRSPADTELIGRTPGGVEVPTMGQPVGAPTVAEVIQPLEPPTLPPVPAPARRSRWSLLLVGAAAAGVVLIVGAVLAAVMFLGGGDSLEDMLADAQTALAAGNYDEAVTTFKEVLEEDADNAKAIEGLLEAADNLAQAGQFDGAIAAYETVRQVKPGEVQALRGMGQAYEAQGEWGEAANWYEKWTQAAPADGSASLALGYAHFNLGEVERAVAAYERAESLGASSAEMDTHLGLAYFELTQYDKSVEYLNKAVVLGADRPGEELVDVYYALGGSYFELQDYEQAIVSYQQAQELDPEGQAVWAGEAKANVDEAYPRLAQQVIGEAVLDLDFSNVVTEGEETYAIAKTGQRAKIVGAVHLVDGPWEGSQALVVEEGTTNQFRYPSFELGTPGANGATGWNAYHSGYTLAESGGYAGDGCVRVDGNGTRAGLYTVQIGDRVIPNETSIAVTVWYRVTAYTAGEMALYLTGLENGVQRDPLRQTSFGAGTTSGWVRKTLVYTNQSGKEVTDIVVYLLTTTYQGTVYMDAVQYEKGKDYPTTYCDGDQGAGHAWSGGEHNSTSTRAQTTVSVGDAVGLLSGSDTYSIRVVAQMPSDVGVGWPEPTFNALWNADAVDLMLYYDPNDDKSKLLIDGSARAESSAQSFSAGDWIDLTCTFDYSNDSHKLYVNG